MASASITDQPKGLKTLFLAEMWERFSFYGIRGLLVLYMTSELMNLTEKTAFGIYGAYTALVYATSVIGGILADRILGNQRAVIAGGVSLALGNLFLATAAYWSQNVAVTLPALNEDVNLNLFWIGLGFIVVGTGFFKSNITALLGQLYEKNDPRKDAGFTYYYVGINLGAALSSVICGYIGQKKGWHYGFGIAGVGMLLGLLTFYRGLSRLNGKGLPPENSCYKDRILPMLSVERLVYLGALLFVPIASILIIQTSFMKQLMPVMTVAVIGYMLYLAFSCQSTQERNSLLVILVMMFFHAMFWSTFEQAGCSMNIFAEKVVSHNILGFEVTAAQFQALNPIFIIALGPLLATLWMRLGAKGSEPFPPFKFVLALAQVALGFGALVLGIKLADANGVVSPIWLVLAYLFHTTGELCLSPVGLSMVSKLSPTRVCSAVMGLWFLSISFANYIAGLLAQMTATDGIAGGAVLSTYSDAFSTIMYIGLVGALLLILIMPFLNRVFYDINKEVTNKKAA